MTATGRRSLNGKRLYSCDGPSCGLTNEPWDTSWMCWSSLLDEEEQPDKILTFCSAECAGKYVDANPDCGIPKPTKLDLKSETGKLLQEMADRPLRGSRTLR